VPPIAAGENLDSIVDDFGRMPTVVSGSTDLSAPTTTSVDVNGVAYLVTEQRRRFVSDVIEHAFLQDIAALGVWPGEVIQGNALLVGDVAPIGPQPRQPGTVRITTALISNTPGPQFRDLDNPDGALVDEARLDILNDINPEGSAGIVKPGFERASTLREAGVKLGVMVKGPSFGVDANFALDRTYKSTVVVASLRQIFYSVTFAPHGAGATGFWPEADVRYPEELERYMGAGNPPLYIDSVQYGRFICVVAQGSYSSSELSAALQVSFEAGVRGNVNIDANTREILENSQVNAYMVGVPGAQGFTGLLDDPVNELDRIMTTGRSFSLENPGAPVSFTCRHIADNTQAHVGLVADYTEPLSAQGVDVNQARFEVYDGPGGGLLDTKIRVNPGDRVTINASGQIWGSGIIASGPNGPAGWPGHRADRNAPLPEGTAFCLVARFSSNPQWMEAKAFWENTITPGWEGVLLLQPNDPNPEDGNANYRWEVYVDVKRAGAAAARLYV
jgi:hypothetical protein